MTVSTNIQSAHRPDTAFRLSGGWLRLAWIVWALLTLPHLVMFALMFITIFPTLPDVNYFLQTNPGWTAQAAIAAAGSLGLPLAFFKIYQITKLLLMFAFCLAVGGLILWRKSDQLMGLLVSYVLISLGSLTYSSDLLLAPFGPLAARVWGFVGSLVWPSLFIFFYLFPDGRFVPRWTRWLSLAWLVFFVFSVFATAPDAPADPALLLIALPLFFSAPISQIYRYVRVSGPLERVQIRGILLFAIALIPVLLISILFVGFGLRSSDQLNPSGLLFDLSFGVLNDVVFLMLPILLGVSILRYRLWDIDFVINRALAYGALTLVLVGVFGGGFVALQPVLQSVLGTDQPYLSGAIAAGAAVALFNPARRLMIRLVDERIYGIKLDYVEAVKAYGGTKREARKTGDTKSTFGAYTGMTLLGRGGMGEVYRAAHPTLKRAVAIKILPDHSSTNDEAYKRFMREAQTIAGLKHPNIITLHDVGEQDGKPFMVMEYIDGQDLSEMIKDRGRLPMSEALPILSDIAAALDHAHLSGIIHRDIKPSNVMIEKITSPSPVWTGEGGRRPGGGVRAILMDFGIAKGYAVGTRLTQSGMIGTLDYISPEQIQGAAEVDARADIYSFGVMAYETLTGELPFKHTNPGAMVMAHLMQPAPDPREIVSDLPEDAALAVMRSMSKKPGERFTTAGDMINAIG